ncbi:MAG: FAD-dependent monooxygenase [Legionellaceae bacterium]|nr:FAD-dependent monooxygenase [Legionellaceae bacterium]
MPKVPEVSKIFDVLVIGGGVVGLSAAVAMASRGFKTAVIDAGPLKISPNNKNTRVYAINGASQALLTQLGVWELLDPNMISPYQSMHVWDATHHAEIMFDARDAAKAQLGVILEENPLRAALLQRAEALGVHLISNTRVTACVEEAVGMCVTGDAGDTWQVKLLMVADGAKSNTRELLGVSITTWPYDHEALVATVQTEKPHQATAYQVFTPDGPLAFLPLSDSHQCSIVWSQPADKTKVLMALEPEDFNRALTQAFEHKLGAVKLQSARISFPLHMRHVQQYSGAKWLLMGDAAHTIHPLAGLGLNVGLADLTSWLALLDKQRDGAWSTRVLAAYQRERKSEVWSVIALMQGIKALFGASMAPVGMLRGLGMRALNRCSPLKRMLADYASGD